MTKWKRLRRLRERQRAESEAIKPEAEVTAEITEPEPKLAERISLGDPRKIKKSELARTFNPKLILAQIPRYAYLLTIYALLAGIFFPLITPGVPFDHAIQGIETLSLGLVGGILLFKAATSDKRRGIFIAVGFALISISLVLIYHIHETVRSLYY